MSALHLNPSPLLPLPNLKHNLHPNKQSGTSRSQIRQSRIRPHDPRQQTLQAVDPDREPDQVGDHHHEDVAYGADAAEDTVRGGVGAPSVRGEDDGRDDLGQDEEGDEPPPHEEAEVDVVPEGDEGEDDEEVEDGAGLGE